MLKALKQWRDSPTSANPRHVRTQILGGQKPLIGSDAKEAARVSKSEAVGKKRGKMGRVNLANCSPAKEVFLEGVAQAIEGGCREEQIFPMVETFFSRFGGAALLTSWEWETIVASPRCEEDESLRTMVVRSMTEGAIRLITLVLHCELPGTARLTLRQQLERAEWSVRRGDQTLYETYDEVLAPLRPAEQEILIDARAD